MELEREKVTERLQLEVQHLKLRSLQQEEKVMEIPFTQEERDRVEVLIELNLTIEEALIKE